MKNTKKKAESEFRRNVLDNRGNQVYVGDLVRFSGLGLYSILGDEKGPLVAYEVTWVGKGAISHGEDLQMKPFGRSDNGLTVRTWDVVKLTASEEAKVKADHEKRAPSRLHQKILRMGRAK